jgi:hypothetical protein
MMEKNEKWSIKFSPNIVMTHNSGGSDPAIFI